MRRILSIGNVYFDWHPDNLSLSDGKGPSLGYASDFAMNIHIPKCF